MLAHSLNQYRRWYIVLCLTSIAMVGHTVAQCDQYQDEKLSPKLANYVITADLDRETHTAYCTQEVTWTNSSPIPVQELRLYMYMNAFKSRHTTFLQGVTKVFGADLSTWRAHEWGHIAITRATTTDGTDITPMMTYVQPNDGNPDDETVLAIELPSPVPASETVTLLLEFEVKLPKTIVRAGYGKNDFHLFVHWFPQMGVYEINENGHWDWNCHQFMQKTEFYADFGNYDVTVTTDSDFVVGASGCLLAEHTADGRTTRQYIAYDIIDFGFTAYPLYEKYTDRWQDVDIELLIPAEHCGMAARYIDILKYSLDYLTEHVGRYYYPKITLVDPPVHSLRSGFMEYPMMCTVASVYGTPESFRGSESLAIHEFAHMYFMGMLASNEKEEAWLDEGFVTFFEDEILDSRYGSEASFYDFGMVRTGNAQKSRQEYTTLAYPEHEVIAKPGWENKGYYKALVYGKTATVLRTFQNIIGTAAFGTLIRHYFEKHKFTHPKEADWLAAIDTTMKTLPTPTAQWDYQEYWRKALHTTHIVDYEVLSIDHTNGEQNVVVRNRGKFDIPTSILITYADGSTSSHLWDGSGKHVVKTRQHSPILTAHIDPEQKIVLDLNYINNSKTTGSTPIGYRQAADAGMISEVLLHLLSLLL